MPRTRGQAAAAQLVETNTSQPPLRITAGTSTTTTSITKAVIPSNDSEGRMAAVLPIANQETWESDYGSNTSWQSAPSSSSLGSDQYLLGYSPNTLRPIIEVRRSDPRVALLNCDIQTNVEPQNSEHVANQQPRSDITAQLRDALKSPEIAEMMQSYVTTGLQNFLTHHLAPLQNKVEENERTTNEKIQEIHKAMERNERKIHQLEEKCANTSRPTPTHPNPPEVLPKNNNVIISGIKEEMGENENNITDKINALLQQLRLNIEHFRAQRIGTATSETRPEDSRPRPILLELANPWDKRKIYAARLNLKALNLKSIYINEDLTKSASEIFYNTRQAKKQNFIAKTWTNNGTVYVAKIGEKIPVPINSIETLQEMYPTLKIERKRTSKTTNWMVNNMNMWMITDKLMN